MTRMWKAGEQVLLRSVEPNGKVHSARPVTVVSDDGVLAALQLVVGTRMMWPEFGDRSELIRKFAASEWTFVERAWTDNDVLILLREGDAYSPQLYRSADGTVKMWYVNLQDPVQRTPRGFDTLDHILDVLAGLDLSWWQIKDEHELEEAVQLNVLTPQRANEIRATAAHVGALIDGGDAWWAPWSDWAPDPSWPIPALPDSWDRI